MGEDKDLRDELKEYLLSLRVEAPDGAGWLMRVVYVLVGGLIPLTPTEINARIRFEKGHRA